LFPPGQKGIETAARAIYKTDPAGAMEFLTRYTDEQAHRAWALAGNLYGRLADVEIDILADRLVRRGPGTVEVAIFSNPRFDATAVDPSTVSMGLPHQGVSSWAPPLSSRLEDVNGDGRQDLVVNFSVNTVTRNAATISCYYDLWLRGERPN